jgi:RHS repeat-associated protein
MQNASFINPCVGIRSTSDYSGFGVQLDGRTREREGYRYGFQGQEKDDEVKGEGNSVNYTFRMHDPRVGRFFAVDPLQDEYPFWSPYVFSGNQVTSTVELEGLEPEENINLNEHSPPDFGSILNVTEVTISYNTQTGATNAFIGPIIRGVLRPIARWLSKQIGKLFKSPKPKTAPKSPKPQKATPKPKNSSPKSKNKLEPNKEAEGDHSTFQRGEDGKIHKYETYKKEKGTNFSSKKRYDGGKPDGSQGKPHIDKKTGKEIDTPHINEPGGNVRKPNPSEIPKGGGKN